MPRIGAMMDTATMVYLKSFWNWAYKMFVGESMRISKFLLSVFVVRVQDSISRTCLRACPLPTSGIEINGNLFKESVYDGARNWSHCHAEIIA
jgi:hypothetical protein